jgi:cytochrome c biogenesis factor
MDLTHPKAQDEGYHEPIYSLITRLMKGRDIMPTPLRVGVIVHLPHLYVGVRAFMVGFTSNEAQGERYHELKKYVNHSKHRKGRNT